MPRSKKGPRLFLRRRSGRQPVYVILDSGGHEESTGYGPGEERGAEEALQRFLAGKHESAVGTHAPSRLPVADLLNFYADAKRPPDHARPNVLRAYQQTLIFVDHLLAFFGGMVATEIRGATCRDYVKWRGHSLPRAPQWPIFQRRKACEQSARRELVVLSAAVNLYHREYGLDAVPAVTLPEMAPTKRQALSHSEAAALLAGALGFYRVEDGGAICRRPLSTRTQRKRTARFIIIGLYSGSRHSAITSARWVPSIDAPWIDVDRGVLHRRGSEEAETNKRRPPARIPPRLLTHLRRWHAMDMSKGETHVLARSGRPLAGKLRRGWVGARTDARLPASVTPHVLRHTAATWLAQGGLKARVAADFLGMSEAIFEKVYYSASPDYQTEIGPGFAASKAQAAIVRERNRGAPKEAQETPAIQSTKREHAKRKPHILQ